jgi:hypothetical protein
MTSGVLKPPPVPRDDITSRMAVWDSCDLVDISKLNVGRQTIIQSVLKYSQTTKVIVLAKYLLSPVLSNTQNLQFLQTINLINSFKQ